MAISLLDALYIPFTSALLGVLFLTSISPLEFERYMFHYLTFYTFIFLGRVCVYGFGPGRSFVTAFAQTSLVALSFNVSLFVSIAVYRLFGHRCRKFPGPVLARLTRFYVAYLNAKGYQFYKELGELHERYGDIVRTGPREISILDKAAIPAIYGPNTECRKSTWYGQSGNDPNKVSINMTRDTKQYRLRRRAWDRGFSTKALASYQPRVKSKADVLIRQLYGSTGSSVDITKWSMLFAFDIMGEVGFGKDFNSLASGQEHPAIKGIHEHIAVLGVLQTVPWFLNLLGTIPGAAASFSEFFSVCEKELEEKERTWNSEKEPQDIVSWLLKAIKDKDVSASPTRESLTDDSRVVIIAGSDTTANTLANVLFYLAKHPAVQRKLRNLVDTAIPEGYTTWNYEKIKTITYIDDIINETLRLKPPIIQGGSRETPDSGIRIGDTYIPGNVNVSVPYLLIQRDPRWWKHPNDFIPERFGERRTEMGTDDAPFFPFQLGMHACAGKNLAFLSLRTAVSAIVQNFVVDFAPGETGEEFDERFRDTFLMTLLPLQLQFTPRAEVHANIDS